MTHVGGTSAPYQSINMCKSHETISVCDDHFFKTSTKRLMIPRLFWSPLLLRPHVQLHPRILVSKSHRNTFIHFNLISCSLIGSFIDTRSALKMSTALRVLRPDCTRCFWCVIARTNVTSTDPFFALGKVVNILHV